MGNELISVIIPVYNAERYLASCLDSILSQSYRNLEVIIINDGSSDYSLRVAEGYAEKDDRVRVYSFENEGPSEARNRGLSVATGDYLTFVDSDDLL
ncbi:MAG: glycosyltransferase, partial [Muribaculaceae bacterium]|nr:glycosyltransferase [Muribaculaceae bacterium]